MLRPYSVLLVLMLLLIAACGRSVPTNYYALTAPTEQLTLDRLPRKTLRIARVAIPQYLDREPIVTHKSTVGELHVDSIQIWAEPLNEGIRRILQNTLSPKLLQTGINVLPLASEETGNYVLFIDVLRLDGALGGQLDYSCQWRLTEISSNRTLAEGIFSAQKPLAAATYKEYVQATSTILHEFGLSLADRIMKAIK